MARRRRWRRGPHGNEGRYLLAATSAIALIAGSAYFLWWNEGTSLPPEMRPTGEKVERGILTQRRTVDYETVLRTALTKSVSLVTMQLKADVVRDQHLETSVRYLPLPSSTARVRVKYYVEYAFGLSLKPGDFSVAREGDALVVRVRPARLVTAPSVKLLSYKVLDSGILIDEKTAVIVLQQRIQPEAEVRGRELAKRPSVQAVSRRALEGLIRAVLDKASEGADPPPRVIVRYR